MRLYNTLTRQKENFVFTNDCIKIYSCGPTVYNFIHIGNARPLCVFDVLRRYLDFLGYKVKYVQNFTDIDDKIIKKSLEEKISSKELSNRYIQEYMVDAKGLNLLPPDVSPKVTETMDDIIKMISVLVEKGYAYKVSNGDVFFDTKKFSDYGKLSGQSLDELENGVRIEVDTHKKHPMDFALWKSAKPNEPQWDSPWGKGRPGWHIECSTMAKKYLGDTIDIHCGGQDLIFPHHENEIAQSQCANSKVFSKFWLHNGYINIDNKKMSKSLNNFFTVREISKKFGYETIRYLMISSHYRSPINYSDDIMVQCKSALDRLYNCRDNMLFILDSNYVEVNNTSLNNSIEYYNKKFCDALDDDLNTADALSVIFELAKDININFKVESCPNKNLVRNVLNFYNRLANVIGILYNNLNKKDIEIENLINLRLEARKNKDWALADKIRNELNSKNVILEDTKNGTKWHYK